ncbi:hypothetical protein NL108_017459 [Boleophthalmus pectinirostris]|nr:hypothetical protein NL108_017459 [Boleophthalmus pectinirostris]
MIFFMGETHRINLCKILTQIFSSEMETFAGKESGESLKKIIIIIWTNFIFRLLNFQTSHDDEQNKAQKDVSAHVSKRFPVWDGSVIVGFNELHLTGAERRGQDQPIRISQSGSANQDQPIRISPRTESREVPDDDG